MIRQSEGGHLQYFEWDALGRLIRSKNDKAETHYRYDALGRRIEKQKQHSQAGRNHYTETTAYGWDGDTLAYESTNLYTKHYVYENGSFVPLIQATYRQQINQHLSEEKQSTALPERKQSRRMATIMTKIHFGMKQSVQKNSIGFGITTVTTWVHHRK